MLLHCHIISSHYKLRKLFDFNASIIKNFHRHKIHLHQKCNYKVGALMTKIVDLRLKYFYNL